MPTSEVEEKVTTAEVDTAVAPDDNEPPKVMSFKDLKSYDGELWVQNVGPTLFTCRNNRKNREVDLEVGPAGSDEDIAPLPREAIDEPGFRRAVAKGIIKVSADPDCEDRIDINVQASVAKDIERRNAIVGVTEESATKKDLVPKTCVVCNSMTFQALRDVSRGIAPTCPIHLGEADQYVSTQLQNGEWSFTRRQV